MNRHEHAPGLCLALQIVREVAKTQPGYSDEREAIYEALSKAYAEARAPEQMLETGRRPGLATLRAAQPTYDELRQRLLDLAEGARSKADLIASKSPSSAYTNPIQVLRAVAEEAEAGLIKQPNARWTHAQALGKIQKILSGERWTVEDLESIAVVMRSTGYDINDVDESEDPNPGYDTLEYSVCTDCFQFIANDEVPEDKDHAFYAGKIALELGGKGGHFSCGVTPTEDDPDGGGDVEFSRHECELCRSSLGGSRHGVTLFIKKED